MSDKFYFIGTLSMSRPTERFSPYEERHTDNGWVRKQLRVNCHTDSGNQFLQFSAMKKPDETNTIHFHGDKGEKIIVPFSERNEQKWIKKVPNHQRYVIDLETDIRKRKEMANLFARYENPEEIPKNQIEALGFENLEDLQQAYKFSLRKRKEFLSQWDYIETIKKMLENPNYKDIVFKVDGKIEISHSRNGKDYLSYVPTSISVYNREVKDPAMARVKVFYDENSLSENQNGLELNAFLEYFDSWTKKRQYSPYSIIIPVEGENEDVVSKKKKVFRRIFRVDSPNEVRCLDLFVDLINQAPKKKMTLDDLDEETREMVELGILSENEAFQQTGFNYRSNEIVRSNVYKTIKGDAVRGGDIAGVTADKLGYFDGSESDFADDLPF